jgi:hypothetical protein
MWLVCVFFSVFSASLPENPSSVTTRTYDAASEVSEIRDGVKRKSVQCESVTVTRYYHAVKPGTSQGDEL